MSNKSKIEWTDTTWNPSTGCSVVSSGCKYCYAKTLSKRLKAMGSKRYVNEFEFTIHEDKITDPLKWKGPRKVFVNSMSDLFHENSTLEFVEAVFRVMGKTPQHQYQVLTKRPERMRDWLCELEQCGSYVPSEHIWLGTSVESSHVKDRVSMLKEVPAGIRFLSCEPLLGRLNDLDLEGLDWVIVGGESGRHLWKERTRQKRALVDLIHREWSPRNDRVDWVREIRDQCIAAHVSFFFKQWGGPVPKASGNLLDGRTWEEFPAMNEAFKPESEALYL